MHQVRNFENKLTLKDALVKNRDDLLSLVEDWHFFKTVKYSRLVFEYDQIFGDLEMELNKKNSEAEKLQEKIDKLVSKRRTEQRIDHGSNYQVDYELNDFKKTKISKLYRKIVKKLHPDTCENLELNKKYWNHVQNAYKQKNDRHLEIIYDTISTDPNSLERDQLVNEIRKLERYIRDEKENLHKLKNQEPYIYEKKLKDRIWVNQRKRSLENKLDHAEKRLSLKKKIYENMLVREKSYRSELVN